MPNIILGFGHAITIKKYVLEIDNYYDVQRPKGHNKVSKAVSFLKDHALKWWTSKKTQHPKVQANLTSIGFMELFC